MLNKIKQAILIISTFIIISCGNESKQKNQSAEEIQLTDSVYSIKNISEEIRKNPRNAQLFVERARLQILENNINEALNDLTIATQLDSLNPAYHIRLADLYLKIGKSSKTKEVLDKCIRLNPESDEATHRLANLYFYVQEYKKAMEWLNKTQEINPNLPQLYFTKGLLYKETGDTQMAIRNFHIAVEKEPDYYDAYILLGLIHADLKDTLAIAYYENAIKILPKSLEAHYNKAIFLQENNYIDRSIEEYQIILEEIDSLQQNVHFNLGYIYMHNYNEYQKAIEKFSKVIEINKSYIAAYYNRGFCQEQLKNYHLAEKDYKTALKLAENYDLALEGLNRIDRLKK